MAKILIVEDDVDLAQRVRAWLEADRYVTEVTHDGKEAMEHLSTKTYDVIVLDLQLPGMSGLDICKRFRVQGGLTPIIMLTGRDQLSDKETGLDSGADDYLTKPFNVRELSARIRALLRRSPQEVGQILSAGSLELDTTAHTVRQNGRPVDLLPTEFALLEFLMRNSGQLFSPEALLEHVWQSDSSSTVETVYTCIKRLRTKLDKDKKDSPIKTIHGIGYKFEI